MNVLSGRVTYNKTIKLTGNIYFNGELMEEGVTSNSAIAYVAQDDKLFAFLTVRETLQLAAYFNCPASTTSEERHHRVESIIRELALTKAADTILGNDTTRGVSGGEYKRVLIGKELIKKPDVMFFDEPVRPLP